MSNKQKILENNARIDAVTELLKTKKAGGGSGEGITDGLAKMIAGESVELVPSDFGNITKIARNVFANGVITKITLPNTITKIVVPFANTNIKEINLGTLEVNSYAGLFGNAKGLEIINNGELNFTSGEASSMFQNC